MVVFCRIRFLFKGKFTIFTVHLPVILGAYRHGEVGKSIVNLSILKLDEITKSR